MTKVKVFVHGRRRRRGYDNSSPDFRHGELKMRVSFLPKSDIHCNRSATSPRPKFKTIAEVAEESQLGFAVGRRLVGD